MNQCTCKIGAFDVLCKYATATEVYLHQTEERMKAVVRLEYAATLGREWKGDSQITDLPF